MATTTRATANTPNAFLVLALRTLHHSGCPCFPSQDAPVEYFNGYKRVTQGVSKCISHAETVWRYDGQPNGHYGEYEVNMDTESVRLAKLAEMGDEAAWNALSQRRRLKRFQVYTGQRARNQPSRCVVFKEHWVVKRHQGMVLSVSTRERQLMSDVWGTAQYATVWNPETGTTEEVSIWTSGDCVVASDYASCNAEVDATPEVLEAFAERTRARTEAARIARKERSIKAAEKREKADRKARGPEGIENGRRMRVIKGRKVPRNTAGTVQHYMLSKFDDDWVVLLNTGRENVWVKARFCEFI